MTTTTTATIETLTASVHVLTMGNRQITIGVYRQLDHVPHKDLEPFGRVRDSQDQGGTAVYVIGQHKETGALVKSALGKPTWQIPERYMSPEFHHWASHARPGQKVVPVAVSEVPEVKLFAESRGFPCPNKTVIRRYQQLRDDARPGKSEEREAGSDCDMPSLLEAVIKEVRLHAKPFERQEQAYREALALPLIVLASR